MQLMNLAILDMVDDGEVPGEAYARYCFPVVPRTVAEAGAPVVGALADRWELLLCGLTPVPSPHRVALEKSGDVVTFARTYTASTRAFSESSLREGVLRHARAGADAAADRLYAAMQDALAARPDAYPFDDLALAVMVRRRMRPGDV